MEQSGKREADLKERLSAGQEYYEVRLESIGGLGANLCGKMLGELGVRYLGLNSISFSSYGSEKTGTPVKGFIRYSRKEKEIRDHSPVVNPDLLVLFHHALLREKAVLEGCNSQTVVLLATEADKGAEECLLKERNLCACYTLAAQKIAMETGSRINVVMLGAILRVMGIEQLKAGQQICRDSLGKKYPDALAANLEGMKRGYDEVVRLNPDTVIRESGEGGGTVSDVHPRWGYANAPIGGVNPWAGSTVTTDVAPSRQGYIPIFIKERCINCGLCHSTCPDMVFQFEKGTYRGKEMMINKGLDYYHCKGCLRCVDVCPVNALRAGVEAEEQTKPYFLPNQELFPNLNAYAKAGPDGYITSEAFLTEKRMKGGEV